MVSIPIGHIKNIAVCLSGECRSYNLCSESIKNFFDIPGVNVKYFAHAWNTNSYKVKRDDGVKFEYEEHPVEHIDKDMRNYYPFQKLKVEEKFKQEKSWDNLFYSDAVSNLFKREYELANNMTFDIVVKCRFDLVFSPGNKFMNILPLGVVQEKTIYSDIWPMPVEWGLPNIDDVFYYGTSLSMDIMNANMTYIANRMYHTMYDNMNPVDNPYYMSGPGINMYRWIKQTNMTTHRVIRPFIIYRRQAFNLNPVTQYHEVVKRCRGLF